MNSVKDESLLSRHAKFLIKELSETFRVLEKKDFQETDLQGKMFVLRDDITKRLIGRC